MNDNKQILKAANAAVAQGDYEKFLSFCTDVTIWNFIGERKLSGKHAVRGYMQEAYVEPPRFMVEQLIAEDDFVTAIGKISLKNQDGDWKQYAYCDVWRLRGDKLHELKAFVFEVET